MTFLTWAKRCGACDAGLEYLTVKGTNRAKKLATALWTRATEDHREWVRACLDPAFCCYRCSPLSGSVADEWRDIVLPELRKAGVR